MIKPLLFILSLSPSLSLFSFFSPPQRRSLSLPLFLSLFLLSPSATVSLATESTVSLSPSLSLFSFFSPPQRRSLSPSLSLFSFFSPPQRRSLSPSLSLFSFFSPPQRRSLSLPLFSLLFLLSPSATVSLATESRVSLAEADVETARLIERQQFSLRERDPPQVSQKRIFYCATVMENITSREE